MRLILPSTPYQLNNLSTIFIGGNANYTICRSLHKLYRSHNIEVVNSLPTPSLRNILPIWNKQAKEKELIRKREWESNYIKKAEATGCILLAYSEPPKDYQAAQLGMLFISGYGKNSAKRMVVWHKKTLSPELKEFLVEENKNIHITTDLNEAYKATLSLVYKNVPLCA